MTNMPISLAREIARQGEARLTALLNLGTAADMRATALCGIFGATGIGVLTAVLTYWTSDNTLMSLIVSGCVAAFCLFVAAIIAAYAAAPRDFYIAGGSPDLLFEWARDGEKWRDEVDMLYTTAKRQSESIAQGEQVHKSVTAICFSSPDSWPGSLYPPLLNGTSC